MMSEIEWVRGERVIVEVSGLECGLVTPVHAEFVLPEPVTHESVEAFALARAPSNFALNYTQYGEGGRARVYGWVLHDRGDA